MAMSDSSEMASCSTVLQITSKSSRCFSGTASIGQCGVNIVYAPPLSSVNKVESMIIQHLISALHSLSSAGGGSL